MDYEKLHKDTIAKLQEMVNSGKITIEIACGICADFVPESEDERIRKALIEFVQGMYKGCCTEEACKERDMFLTWLEKQGENTTTLPKWKYKKDNAPLLRDSIILNKYGCVAKSPSGALVSDVWVIDYDELAKLPKEEFEKQCKQNLANSAKTCKDEQKPAKSIIETWKDMRLEVYQQASGNRHEPNCSDDTTKMFSLNDIDEIVEKMSEQKHAWSEEDEEMLRGALALIETVEDINKAKDCFLGVKTWLKSLKDRVQSQPKQEENKGNLGGISSNWNEEDENEVAILESYIRSGEWSESHIDRALGIVDELVNKAKSLRPQKQWKPSEEQMEALEQFISEYKDIDDNFRAYPISHNIESLYNDLKKLTD